jgi:1-acyl-sn-glycerol-3-phosphate acyltransferase
MLYWVIKGVLGPLFRVVFRIQTSGKEHLPEEGPVILAANHQAFCDSLFIPLVVRRRVTFLAKAEYFDDPKSAWFYRAVGQIPIRRGDGTEAARSLETAAEVLDERKVVALYPEGTRSPDERCYRGHTGIARLALETRAPVVPIGIRGTAEVQPIGSRMLRPFRKVTVAFGEPMKLTEAELIAVDDDEHEALRGFTDELMAAICALSGRPYVDEYAPRAGR